MTARSAGALRIDRALLPFRSDALGLQGLAVLCLVLFHYGAPIPGGHVAVDVLLVVSGFLMGGRLWRELATTGEMRLAPFLAARVRRVLWPLLMVCGAVFALSWGLLLPDRMEALSGALLAALGHLANLSFWLGGAAPMQPDPMQPLATYWSLSLAAQTVLVLAGVVTLFQLHPRRVLACLVLLWSASLGICVLSTPFAPEAAGFLLPFRLWEGLSGALLAIALQESEVGKRPRALVSWLGAAMVLAAVGLNPVGPHNPGIVAVVPVLGTLLLLLGGTGNNAINQVLTHPRLVSLSKGSFGLFLWHWPVLVLTGVALQTAPNALMRGVLLLVAALLAWMLWWLVQRPLRRGAMRLGAVPLWAAGAALMLLAIIGLRGVSHEGYPDRLTPTGQLAFAASRGGDAPCGTDPAGPLMGLELCRFGPEGPARVMIWGDESLDGLGPVLRGAATEPTLLIRRAGCPPLFGLRPTGADAAQQECVQANTQIRQALARLDSVERVILAGRWAFYVSGHGVGRDGSARIDLRELEASGAAQPQAQRVVSAAAETVKTLRQRVDRVAILRQPPELLEFDARALAQSSLPGTLVRIPPATSVPIAKLAVRAGFADAPWMPLAERGLVEWLDPWPLLCDAATCSAVTPEAVLYRSHAHLAPAGWARIWGLMPSLDAAPVVVSSTRADP